MSIADIDRHIDINAPIERVWQAMTSGGLVEQWLGCMGYRPEIGAVFYMQQDPAKREAGDTSGATHCELLELASPDTMVFSWYFPGTPKTEVQILLSDLGNGVTRARLTHSGWDQFDGDQIRMIRDGLDGGWSSYVLPGLKRVAEGR
jgi:uncharacterized protein YndB with AHSA1/START domain